MTRRPAALVGMVLMLGLAGGCAAQQEEGARNEAQPAAAEREAGELESPPAAEPAAEGDFDANPSFAEIQRELAANNAKLRDLGVALPPADGEDQGKGGGTEAIGKSTSKTSSGAGLPSGAIAPAPTSSKSDRSAEKKTPRRDKANRSKAESKDKDSATLENVAAPEPAKAAPLTPNDDARDQDAVGVCQQICDLAAISCGLGEQICELADRHPEEEDYVSACERANGDCDAAKEACNVCTE